MKTPEQQNYDSETLVIRRLIELRLKARWRDEVLSAASIAHPDEDVVSTFMEGRLDAAESLSIVSHLVNCASCLHLTADLVRFEPDMNEFDRAGSLSESPGPFRMFLDRIAEGVIPSGGDAVFAYQEKDEPTNDGEPEPGPESSTKS
jgi:hypothetical protein